MTRTLPTVLLAAVLAAPTAPSALAAEGATPAVAAPRTAPAGDAEALGLAALVEGRPVDAFRHHLEALASGPAEARPYLLARLDEAPDDPEAWAGALPRLESFARSAGDPAVAARALALAARWASRLGRADEARRLLDGLSFVDRWQVVSGFDNDRMRGCDLPWPPEQDGVDLQATYRAQQGPARWREAAIDRPSGEVPLADRESPDAWSVAYLAAWVHSPAARPVELRLRTSDAVRVFVNGREAGGARDVEAPAFDNVVLGTALEAGWNEVLVKSCQATGPWGLGLRLTGPGGAPLRDLRLAAEPPRGRRPVVAVAPAAAPPPELPPAASPVRDGDPARRALREAVTLHRLGRVRAAKERFDALLARPDAPSAAALDGARVAADLDLPEQALAWLDAAAKADPALAGVPLARAHLFESLGQRDRALEEAERALALAPGHAGALRLQARLLRQKGWLEESRRVLEDLRGRCPGALDPLRDLALCAEACGDATRARALATEVLQRAPGDPAALERLAALERRRENDAEAVRLYRRYVDLRPQDPRGHLWLGEALRSLGHLPDASAAFEEAARVAPGFAPPHQRLGEVALACGRNDEAVAHWRRAAALAPDAPGVWERLERLDPARAGVLADRIPDDRRIDEVVRQSPSVAASPSASFVVLLDHEADELFRDGSVRRVVTFVVRVEDADGAGRFASFRLPPDGHVSVLRAFTATPSGERHEVTSIRDRTLRYRDLGPGALLVLQFRHDTWQATFFNGHWHRTWHPQWEDGDEALGQWVVAVPADRPLTTRLRGEVEATTRRAGDRIVYEWTARKVPPLRPEPGAPPFADLAWGVAATTLPDWDAVARWQWSLVREPARPTPDVVAQARSLVPPDAPADRKVEAVRRFASDAIRYVQDYEEPIAGMRPHAAGVTLARGYGDCKDKAVLMIALLDALGVRATFEMIGTRATGRLVREVPSQQFDHAIVYVPAQPGIPEGRHHDPTAELLDDGNLRRDDQGQTALAIDADGHRFLEVPFDPPVHESLVLDVEAALPAPGAAPDAEVRVHLSARGDVAARLRRDLPNRVAGRAALEGLLGTVFPGAGVRDYRSPAPSDTARPVEVDVVLSVPGFARAAGDRLRVEVPAPVAVAAEYARWTARRHPLSLGAPMRVEVNLHLSPPEGLRVAGLPVPATVEAGCLRYRMEGAREDDGSARVRYVLERTCGEVAPADYPAFRDEALRIARSLDEAVSLVPQGRLAATAP